ncbi:beta-galactosidase [Streptomyces zhihengii]
MSTVNGDRFWFGGDYNPEQWPAHVWDEDVKLMGRAGVTVATVGVFSWSRLQPAPDTFDFAWLDDVMGRLAGAGIGIDLATATASPPPWLVAAHPGMAPVTADGVVLGNTSRQHYSPHSPVYREHALALVRALAERYGQHPGLVAWHVNNEYACHVPRCYGPDAEAAFRVWLRAKYSTVEALNAAWGTAFWSQRYGDFEEIMPPRTAPTASNPTQLIDFDRFTSDAFLDLFRAEAEIVRAASPGIPVTTNFMGAFRPLDYWKWAREVDFVSDDSYPDPADPQAPAAAALTRDLMRSLGNGKPWVLMEQATSAVNWRPANAPKAPGQNRAYSLQAVARGADGIMYFQWRQSAAGAEKFHSGMLPHAGPDSRVFREVCALGAELADLSRLRGTEVSARIGIVFDWDSWWALEQESTPTRLDYLSLVQDWYRAFWARDAVVDFLPADGPFDGYDLVVVPALHVADEAALTALAAVPERGGRLAVGFMTGVLDRDLRVPAEGYLGSLAGVLGVRVEEFAPVAPAPGGPAPVLRLSGALGELTAGTWAEFTHAVDAEVRASFDDGVVRSWPAVTRRGTGSGDAWYVATRLDAPSMDRLVGVLLDGVGAETPTAEPNERVEVVRRGDTVFVINHSAEEQSVTVHGHGRRTLAPHGTEVLPG